MSKKMFRVSVMLVVLALAVSSAFVFAAEKTKIEVWAWPGATDSLEQVVPGFVKENPNIEVNITPITAGDPIVQKYLASVAAKSGGPDVIAIDGVVLQNYISKGALMDISSLMEPIRHDFVQYKMSEIMSDNKFYACPWDIGPVGLYYRQDIFDKYKIPAPTTWTEYLNAGKKLRAHGNYNITSLVNTGDVYWFETLFRQAGVSVFDAKGQESIDPVKATKVFEYLKTLYEAGVTYNPGSTSYINGWTPAFWSAMRSGKVATYVGAAWFVNVMKSYVKPTDGGYGKWRIAPLPVFEKGGLRSSNQGGSNLGIYPYTKNKEEAWAFIKYAVASVDGARTQSAFGTFPSYLPALKDAKVLSHTEPLYGGQATNKIFAELQGQVFANYYRPAAYTESILAIAEVMGKYMRDDINVDDAIKEMKDRVRKIAAQY